MATVAMPLSSPSPSTTTIPLALAAAALRHFHLLFALGSHLLFDRIFNHARTTLDVDRGIRVAVSIMVRRLARSLPRPLCRRVPPCPRRV